MYAALALFLMLLASHCQSAEACWELAASEGGISIELLRAIARTESSMNPRAVNASHEHITGTRDVGLVGINTAPAVLRRLSVSESDLYDPCMNLRIGARILREKMQRHGATWEAVGAYCVSCTRLKGDACQTARAAYAWRVYRAMHGDAFRGTGPRRSRRTSVGSSTFEPPDFLVRLK